MSRDYYDYDEDCNEYGFINDGNDPIEKDYSEEYDPITYNGKTYYCDERGFVYSLDDDGYREYLDIYNYGIFEDDNGTEWGEDDEGNIIDISRDNEILSLMFE